MTDTLIQQAVQTLRDGGVIAYPTEAVWGLGCDPANEAAVKALLALKQRPVEKGLILIAADIEQMAPYLKDVNNSQYQQLLDSWPGFQTWIVPAPETVPVWVKGEHTGIALRVSAHPVVQALCDAFGGPLVSTSANPSGEPAALSEQQVQGYFSEESVFILPGALGGEDRPSSIIDITTGKSLR